MTNNFFMAIAYLLATPNRYGIVLDAFKFQIVVTNIYRELNGYQKYNNKIIILNEP